jgi:hypothetical protein
MTEERTMDEPIPPALSAEAWATREIEEIGPPGDSFTVWISDEPGWRGGLQIRADDGYATIPSVLCPGVMALANAALPADDPRKITRADVELLREAVYAACACGDRDLRATGAGFEEREYHQRRADQWATVVAKLAALLPPKERDAP